MCFLMLTLGVNLPAQNRGGELEAGAVKIVNASGEVVAQFKEAYALVIGESDYIDTEAWEQLKGVKEDVIAIKRLFEEQGFFVEKIENADSNNLKIGITNFLNKYGHRPDTRIIVYFAGHGATVDVGDNRKRGYIVPIDAPQASNNGDFLQKAIPMEQFKTWALEYHRSRHILFIFDSCFAGSVFRSQSSRPPAIDRLINQRVRQFITAGGADEEVDDYSVFRRELEYGLRDGAADLNNDGYVSGTELGLYLYEKVSNHTNGKQNPRVEKLRDIDFEKGDFIFPVNNPQNGSSTVRITPNSQTRQLPEHLSDTAQIQNPTPGTKEFFIGSWLATVDYNNSYDTYKIIFQNYKECTVTISNDDAEQTTTGTWSWNDNTKRLNLKAVFGRDAKISYQRNFEIFSMVRFADDNNVFNTNAKPAVNAPNPVSFKFFRE